MREEQETRTLAGQRVLCEADDAVPLARGKTLGRYVLLSCLGTGGIGAVYAAYDPELERKVALKVLRPDLAGERGRRPGRLLEEARTLAKLTHPNVVAVHDVGTVGEQVFIAMELVAGHTLTQWQREKPRSTAEVVKVFIQAGRGLAAAHRALLAHRDFKPSNVIVGEDGRVRVLDFGLARPVMPVSAPAGRHDAPARSAKPPRQPSWLGIDGTPLFMAPEQHRGLPADPRSDQFSFCVALYWALYGEPPFGKDSAAEMRTRIERGEVSRPDGKRRVSKRLRRILLRGLSAVPAERYPSMEELLDALRRDPVIAGRRWLATTAGLALLALGSFAYQQSRWQAGQVCAGAERKLSGIWDAQRRAVIRGVFLETGLPYAEATWERVEADLDAHTEGWTGMHREACAATRLRGEQSEELLDLRMACLNRRLQEVEALVAVFGEADGQVLAQAVSAVGALTRIERCADFAALNAPMPLPEDPTVRDEIEAFEVQIARGKALHDAGKYQAAREVLEPVVAAVPNLRYRPLEARTLLRFAPAVGRTGNLRRAEELLSEAVLAAQAGGADRELAEAWTILVALAAVQGKFQEGYRWARLAGAVIERLGGDVEIEGDLYNNLAMLAHGEGDYEKAEKNLLAALASKQRAFGSDHPVFALSLNNLGGIYLEQGAFDRALDPLLRALALFRRSFGDEHPQTVLILHNVGEAYYSLGRLEEAVDRFQESIAMAERTDASGPDLALPLMGLGQAWLKLGDNDRAAAVIERALDLRLGGGGDSALVANSQFALAKALDERRPARARELAIAARQTYRELGERTRDDLVAVENWLAEHDPAPKG